MPAGIIFKIFWQGSRSETNFYSKLLQLLIKYDTEVLVQVETDISGKLLNLVTDFKKNGNRVYLNGKVLSRADTNAGFRHVSLYLHLY